MTGPTPGPHGGAPAHQFRKSRVRRVVDAVVGVLVRWGLVPRTFLLTTTGRKTGRPLTHPATVVEHDGRRWLVSPYGVVSWVRNVRAGSHVALHRRRERHEYTAREVSAAEAGPVLKEYVRIAGATRPYFRARPDAPVSDFVAEAELHPVFELTPERPTAS